MSSLYSNFKCKSIFLDYLNTICSNNHHLLKILPELKTIATSKKLILAIDEFSRDNEKNIEYMRNVFLLLCEDFTEKKILGIRMMAFDAYRSAINSYLTDLERDSAILLYLEIIDSIEVLYFKNLMNMCKELNFEHIYFRSIYHTAEDNLALFEDICSELLALNGNNLLPN